MTEGARTTWRRRYPQDLPGIWQWRRGPRLIGLLVLLVFALCLGIVAFGPGRVIAAFAAFDGGQWAGIAAVTAAVGGLGIVGRMSWCLVAMPFVAFLLAFFAFGKDWMAPVTLVLAPLYAAWFGRKRPPQPRWGKSQWVLVRERFLRSPLAQIGLIGVVLMYLIAFMAPFLAPMDPIARPDPAALRYVPPLTMVVDPIQLTFWLGSDQFSRDILSRMLHGAWISMTVGLFAVGLSASLGLLFGLIAGYFGGLVDALVMRLVDLMLCIPRLVLLLVVMVLFRQHVPPEYKIHLIILILGATGWMGTSRLVRGEVLSVKSRDFVQAGRALGLSNLTLILKHVAPNCMAPVIVSATLGIGGTILVEASLSFLTLGVDPPTPSWGTMISDGRLFLTKAWWISLFPGLAIVLAVMSFNLLGDGLRDALDPRTIAGGKPVAPYEDGDGAEDDPKEAA